MDSELSKIHKPFDHRHYVPCLRWKLGEYQALWRLTETAKKRITPLIEVPEIGWDFEKEAEAKTLDEHLEPFGRRVRTKWEARPCFVDLKLLKPGDRMGDGEHPVDFAFRELRDRGCAAIPVVGLGRDGEHREAVGRAIAEDRLGVCLRVTLSQAAKDDVSTALRSLVRALGVETGQTDLVLDLGAPNFDPLSGFSRLVESVVLRLPELDKWRTLTVIGTSFPQSMGQLTRGVQLVERHEWQLYKRLAADLSRAGVRVPTFGDYGIAHPEVFFVDMRVVRPAASIRYTTDDAWYIIKGPNVRDHGYGQYKGLCGALLSSPYFAGRDLSMGDAYIEDCAVGVAKTGNLTTWRWVGTNHHIEKVVADVASLFGSSSTT